MQADCLAALTELIEEGERVGGVEADLGRILTLPSTTLH